MNTNTAYKKKDLVLIGGGHSHIAVIKELGMKPLPGTRVTLISEEIYTPYSGMLPGLIAGHYSFDDCHIDLRQLCQWAGIRFVCSAVEQLDPIKKKAICHQYPPLRYDFLSINCGSLPSLSSIKGASKYGHAIKPGKKFLTHWLQWLDSLALTHQSPHIVVVGVGAAGIETILAMHYRLQSITNIKAHFTLISAENNILSSHNLQVQTFLQQHLTTLDIKLINNRRVVSAKNGQLLLDNNRLLNTDFVTWTISAGAQPWLANSGLECDDKGFVKVDKFLRSLSHPDIFAVGDSAAFTPTPLPKAGVYAVRQGPILTKNLIAVITHRSLRIFKPQPNFLSLLSTGGHYAVASRGSLFFHGKWVWYWKNFIDRQFMARFRPKPMAAKVSVDDNTHSTMRCGGCGAKVSSDILQNVLMQLDIKTSSDIVSNQGDDAAIIKLPSGMHWAQSTDFFRSFIDDPYLFGRIAAVHSLGDIYAMGAKPHSALVTAVIPYNQAEIMQDTLLHLMLGILKTLNDENTKLIGGHSGEGPELAVGLNVNGTVILEKALTKAGLNHGDSLILTKPLGTGVLLAANMAIRCQGRWLDNAFNFMLQSNRTASNIFQKHGARSCTDITGFGLLGHLQEMLTASQCGAILTLDNIPVLDGALWCSEQGIQSTLYNANKQSVGHQSISSKHAVFPLLFDPQTAGGLLAGIPDAHVDNCLQELANAGYTAAKIGTIDQHAPDKSFVFNAT